MTSTLQLQIDTLSNALQVQNKILDAQQQISSGLKTTSFQGLSGQVEQFTGVENQLSTTSAYLQNNQTLTAKFNVENTALSQLVTAANNLQNLVLQRRDGAVTANSLNFSQQIQGAFQTIAGLLNTNLGGKYVFSGSSTDVAPVDANVFPNSVSAGTPDNGYYQGSTQDTTATVQPGQTITTSIRGDAMPFQQLMAGLSTARQADTTNDMGLMAQAYTLIQQSVSGITGLQGQVGSTQTTLNNATDFLTTQQTALQTLKDGLINSDLVSLSTKLATYQATLQAAFQSFANINALQLSKYLS